MIGLALVTLVATLAAGITSTFRGAVDEIFTSDYAITAQNNFSPIPTDAAEAVAKVPGVEAVASTRTGEARIFDSTEFVTAVDPDADQVLTLQWKEGSQQTLATLGADGAFVDDAYAEDHDLRVGSPIAVQVPSGKHAAAAGEGHLRATRGRLAVRECHVLERDLRPRVRVAEEPLHVRADERRHQPREHREARDGAGGLPEREGADARGVRRQPDQRPEQHPQHPLRAARAVGHRQPLRDREHARADGLRADARARDAARDRDDAASGAAHDPARERDHGADRRRPRDHPRGRPGRLADRAGRLHRVRAADVADHHLRDRNDRGRHPRRDLPGAPRRASLDPLKALQYE